MSLTDPAATPVSVKKEKHTKKRHRDGETEQDGDRKHKKSKSVVNSEDLDANGISEEPAGNDETKKDKKKRRKSRQSDIAEEPTVDEDTVMADVSAVSEKPHTEEKAQDVAPPSEKKKKKKNKRHSVAGAEATEMEVPATQEEPHLTSDIPTEEKASKKPKRKHRKSEIIENSQETAANETPAAAEDVIEESPKKKRKDKKKHKDQELQVEDTAITSLDSMDIDSPARPSRSQTIRKLVEQPFPFFTQTVSQYLPLFPSGMTEPIEGYEEQHLKPFLNRYVPTLKGVMLAYRHPRIGQRPGQGSLTEESDMADEAVLESIDEYAVSFGWLTAEVEVFKPTRGALLEGNVNLQSEGHLGVVCWDMFNAAIEASRLPQGWRWVDLLSENNNSQQKNKDQAAEESQLSTPEPANENEDDGTQTQLHTTGYWVDDKGQRIRGSLRFRVKNYDVGVSGDYGYLSIEGTMLDEEAEREKVAEEMDAARRRKLRGKKDYTKRIPEFSMTKFGANEEKEQDELAPIVETLPLRAASEIVE